MKEMENQPQQQQQQPQANVRGGFSGPRRVGQAAVAAKGEFKLYIVGVLKVS